MQNASEWSTSSIRPELVAPKHPISPQSRYQQYHCVLGLPVNRMLVEILIGMFVEGGTKHSGTVMITHIDVILSTSYATALKARATGRSDSKRTCSVTMAACNTSNVQRSI